MNGASTFRKTAATVLVVSFVLLAVFLLLPLVFLRESHDSVGIIGGADGPTAILVTGRLWRQLCGVPMTFLGATFIVSLLCLIFSRSVAENCTWKTGGMSFLMSAVFSLGVYCAFSVVLCLALGGPEKYPVRIPVGLAVGTGCLAVFLLLLWYYVRLRRARFSRRGMLFDAVLAVLYVIPFLCAYTLLDNLLG